MLVLEAPFSPPPSPIRTPSRVVWFTRMSMLTENHADRLLKCEWLPKLYEGVAYLAKFAAYPEEGECIFIVTDTKTVWGEVVKVRRFIERYCSLNGDNRGNSINEDSGVSIPPRELAAVSAMHHLRHFVDSDVSVAEGTQTDLVVSIEYQNQRWRWEADTVGHRLSSSILSKHLIAPLIVTTGFSFAAASETPLIDLPAIQLQGDLDRISKIAKRNPLLAIVQALKRPRLTTSLRRVTAVMNGVDASCLPPVVVEYDEMEDVLQEHIPTVRSQAETVRRDKYSPPEKTLRASSFPPNQVSILDRVSPPPVMGKDETLYTGPRRATSPSGNPTRDDSATESGNSLDEPPPKKRKAVIGEPDLTVGSSVMKDRDPSPPQRRNHTSGQTIASSDSDSDSVNPPRKRGGSARPAQLGRGGGTRVKQPLKRGGRRL